MLVVDSSVWIDYFNARDSVARHELRRLLADGHTRLIVPDLVLFEVLRGFRDERTLRQARLLLQTLSVEPCGGEDLALAAAGHYRHLRARGITVRSAIDVMVAAFCIDNDYLLLHSDRDYDAIAEHRGLRVWGH
ncbi:MAG: PIN domain nuclease [Comamonadaceae bacterium]|nr:MAG: PIN domain nuclease [Comamonadaceae bacterium]